MNIVLETERCLLREMDPADGVTMYELNSDPLVIRYTGDPPFENAEAATEFLRRYDAYRKFGMGRWAVVKKDDQQILGWCGLKFLADEDEVDLGYRFFRKYWGQGYATETALACIKYGFENLHLNRIIGRAAVENIASVRVLEKCGLKFDCFNKHFGDDSVQHVISKAEYHGWKRLHFGSPSLL